MRYKIAELVATFFYIGKIKYAPGTFGSLPAFPICYIILYFVEKYKIVFFEAEFSQTEQLVFSVILLGFMASLLMFFVGIYCTNIYIENKQDQDPKEVVIDEVAGQMLTFFLSYFSYIFMYNSSFVDEFGASNIKLFLLFFLPFILFRAFDIFKPWPINFLDKNIKGGVGVMLDDILAAIFAATCQYFIVFNMLNYV